MFDQLMESRPHRSRSTPQMIASIVAHTVAIAVSIQLTRAAAESVVKHPEVTEMRLARAPVVPPPRTEAMRTASASASAAPVLALPVAPVVVPTSIPPIDLSQHFDVNSLNPKGLHRDGGPIGQDRDVVFDTLRLVTSMQADEPVRYVEGPRPVYPPALRQVGVEGSVQMRYIVGVDGRAEPGSIAVIASTNRQFEAPAADAIMQSRFMPARIRGQKVRQIVEQVVRFRLSARG